jgi:hypothetical protein
MCCSPKVVNARWFLFDAVQVGDEAQRRLTRGVEDLDFFIGDEAMEQKNPYSIKVVDDSVKTSEQLVPYFTCPCLLLLLVSVPYCEPVLWIWIGTFCAVLYVIVVHYSPNGIPKIGLNCVFLQFIFINPVFETPWLSSFPIRKF